MKTVALPVVVLVSLTVTGCTLSRNPLYSPEVANSQLDLTGVWHRYDPVFHSDEKMSITKNPGGGFSFRLCAQDVAALLDALRIERVRAIGLSMGAKTLLHLATALPARIDTMVLVSATPRFPDSLRAAAAQFTPEAFDRLSEGELDTLRRRHVHGDGQLRALYAMTRSFATSEGDMAFTPDLLGQISARTLIVHGDRDPLYPIEMALELFRGIPRSSLWIVPNAAHGPVFGPLAPEFARLAIAHLHVSKSSPHAS